MPISVEIGTALIPQLRVPRIRPRIALNILMKNKCLTG